MDSVFTGLSFIIVIGAAVALLMRIIKQPLIIGYIITGIIVGPAILHVSKAPETLTLFSEIGIALLLFIVGLGLNPRILKEVSRTATIVGLSQVTAITIAGTIIGLVAGLSGREALFMGAALAISSTIVVYKLLSDKKEQNRLYGKITISILLAQDLIVVGLLILTSATSNKSIAISSLLGLTLKLLILSWLIYAVTYRILSRFRKLIADNQEFLFLFAVAFGLGSSALFAKAGLSYEIGALVAGVCLASLPYAQEISARLRPLRDFFLIVFFIALGSNLSFGSLSQHWDLIIMALVVAIVLKPIVAMITLGFLGYTKRTAFKSSIALAQVSEFSILLIILAQNKGLVSNSLVSAAVLITLISIAISTYMINFGDLLFSKLENRLSLFERRKTHGEPILRDTNELVLFGYQKGGHEFVKAFKQLKMSYIVIDYDPEVIDILERKRIKHLYGDVTDIELLEEAGVPTAKLIASTTNDFEINKFLISYVEKENPKAVVIVQADSPDEASRLYKLGVSYVILPHLIGSEQIGTFIKHSGLRKSDFKKIRDKHLKYLEKEFGSLSKVEVDEHEKLGKTIIKNVTKLTKARG